MTNTAGDADRFAAAHAALKADPSVQFTFTSPPPDPQPPAWLKAFFDWLEKVLAPVGKFLKWLGSFMPDAPVARILLWSLLAAAALALLWAIYQRLKTGEWRLPRFRQAPYREAETEEEWVPDDAPVRSWLQEADTLAEQGRYAEAIHHLLFRSIEDISRRRPSLVRPALTSREIGTASAIPVGARDLFVGIVRMVERSLFGGRPVDRADWTAARSAYADFALPQAWRG
ncbi:MAG TPA: DUF4129 domain-containing protein [Sphingomicrobium sp.]